jgi:hypothetical protein
MVYGSSPDEHPADHILRHLEPVVCPRAIIFGNSS